MNLVYSRTYQKKFRLFSGITIAFDIPNGAKLLATSKVCRNQAFVLIKMRYGLQFHPEVNDKLINAWFDDISYKDAIIKDFLAIKNEYNRIGA